MGGQACILYGAAEFSRDVDVAELHRVTGGNPFYVSEILEAGWPSVPPTVRDAVAVRLTRLSPGTQHAIEAAAVIGTRVPREQIKMVASDPATVLLGNINRIYGVPGRTDPARSYRGTYGFITD